MTMFSSDTGFRPGCQAETLYAHTDARGTKALQDAPGAAAAIASRCMHEAAFNIEMVASLRRYARDTL
jgi:hypothetical protein